MVYGYLLLSKVERFEIGLDPILKFIPLYLDIEDYFDKYFYEGNKDRLEELQKAKCKYLDLQTIYLLMTVHTKRNLTDLMISIYRSNIVETSKEQYLK